MLNSLTGGIAAGLAGIFPIIFSTICTLPPGSLPDRVEVVADKARKMVIQDIQIVLQVAYLVWITEGYLTFVEIFFQWWQTNTVRDTLQKLLLEREGKFMHARHADGLKLVIVRIDGDGVQRTMAVAPFVGHRIGMVNGKSDFFIRGSSPLVQVSAEV